MKPIIETRLAEMTDDETAELLASPIRCAICAALTETLAYFSLTRQIWSKDEPVGPGPLPPSQSAVMIERDGDFFVSYGLCHDCSEDVAPENKENAEDDDPTAETVTRSIPETVARFVDRCVASRMAAALPTEASRN